jgi:hypothetical protein
MSTVKAKNIKVPNSAGTAEATLSFDGVSVVSDKPVVAQGGSLTLMTAKTATGTSVDFTGIPSWARRVTVMFSGVSTNGTSLPLIQIGDSGGIETSGYSGGAALNLSGTANSAGFLTTRVSAAANLHDGIATLYLIGSNTWVLSGQMYQSSQVQPIASSAGSKTLSDPLTQLRITTVNGTDQFDAGTINVMYEG